MNSAPNRIAGLLVASVLVLTVSVRTPAENVDPDSTEEQFAWAENLGWINLEPLGDGGPGVQVDDFELTGWMWAENAGWISLSCKNTSSCDNVEYGVMNDGAGALSGFAWAENYGWINFSPVYGGVSIDPATGEFAGEAWAENAGWIRFYSDGAAPFRIKTGWRCSPAPPSPPETPTLTMTKVAGETRLSWNRGVGAAGFDVVDGDLQALRLTGGDFSVATGACLADNTPDTTLIYGGDPPPGQGRWLLVRSVNCGGFGTYESVGEASFTPRDEGIAASGRSCP